MLTHRLSVEFLVLRLSIIYLIIDSGEANLDGLHDDSQPVGRTGFGGSRARCLP